MIIHADILIWAKTYTGPKFHAALMDAPYHLTEIVKRFGAEGAAPAKPGRDGTFARLSKGFMGSDWDGVDEDGMGVAMDPETWKAIARHLHPGAFLFVFAGTLNDDLISVAMREAGLRKYHKSMAWGYGSGMPKSTRVDDQLDSAAGRLQKPVGTRKHSPKFAAAEFNYREKDNGFNSRDRETFVVTAPATDLAQAYAGHRYGLQALKPALESILIFQKPYARVTCAQISAATGWEHWCVTTPLEQTPEARLKVLKKWGIRLPSGHVPGQAIQIARKALRVGTVSTLEFWWHPEYGEPELLYTAYTKPFRAWATNNSVACMLVTQGAGALNIEGARIPGVKADGSGNLASWRQMEGRNDVPIWTRKNKPGQNGTFNASGGENEGSAAGRWPANLILSHNFDCNGVCTPGCAVARLGAQSGERPAGGQVRGTEESLSTNGIYGDYNSRSTARHIDEGTAARFFFNANWIYERLEDADPVLYVTKASTTERDAGLDELPTITVDDGRKKPIDNGFQRGETGRKNPHPTVKPISLTKYLASLLLPPDCYTDRRLLIPFAGVGSEVLGALLAGWEIVVGVELEAKHVHVGNLRISKWREVAEHLRTADAQTIVRALKQPRAPRRTAAQTAAPTPAPAPDIVAPASSASPELAPSQLLLEW